MTPYDELWNDGIGLGVWTNINIAHWSLLEEAIDARPRPARSHHIRLLAQALVQ